MKTISIHSILIFTIAQQSLANYVVGPRLLAMLHGRPPLGDQLYYKSSEGALHGPFPKNQVLSWWQQGYFPRGKDIINDHDIRYGICGLITYGYCVLQEFRWLHRQMGLSLL